MKRILYSSPFVPIEWISAHGLRPWRVIPDRHTRAALRLPFTGVCTFARRAINSMADATDAAPVVLATTCDQMRRAGEMLRQRTERPVFFLNVPATWQSQAAHEWYLSEVLRLGAFLEQVGGSAPATPMLAQVLREYDAARTRLRAMCESHPAQVCAEEIVKFHQADQAEIAAYARQESPATPVAAGVRVALVGGPLSHAQQRLFGMIAARDGAVALDATETGERGLPAPFDAARIEQDPLGELQRAYFDGIPDVFRRPNSLLYDWLTQRCNQRGIRGVILVRHVWCDLWHAEAQRLRDRLHLPFLDLDLNDENGEIDGRAQTRIQSFLETLQHQ